MYALIVEAAYVSAQIMYALRKKDINFTLLPKSVECLIQKYTQKIIRRLPALNPYGFELQ